MSFLSWPRRSWNEKKHRICCINHQFRTSRSIVQDDLEVDYGISKVDLLKNPFILVELWMSAVGPFSTISSSDCGSLDSVSLVQDSTVSVAMLLLWRSLEFSAECHILRPTMQPSMRRQFSRCACWCAMCCCVSWLTWGWKFWPHPLMHLCTSMRQYNRFEIQSSQALCRHNCHCPALPTAFWWRGPQKMPQKMMNVISIILLDTSSDCHCCIMIFVPKILKGDAFVPMATGAAPLILLGISTGKFHRG